MDVSRLLEVLIDIEQDSKAGYASHLGGVVQAYTKARDNPAQDLSDEISAATTELAENLSRGVFNDYAPSKKHILEAIGGSSLVGEDALSTLRSRLSAVGFTGAALAQAATEFSKEVEGFRKNAPRRRLAFSQSRLRRTLLSLERAKLACSSPQVSPAKPLPA